MFVKCLINGDLWPVQRLVLTEGYNEGWTFSAVVPGLSDRTINSVSLEIGDSSTLSLAMELESLTETELQMEISGRDKASRHLEHAYFDGSSLHCMSASAVLSALCSYAGATSSGAPHSMNIHYVSTDTQSALELLTGVLETAASRYNSNGNTLQFSAVRLADNPRHVLSDVQVASFSVDYEARQDGIILTKSTPCDINQSVAITKATGAHDNGSGGLSSITSLSATVPDMSEWVKLCQSARFDPSTDATHVVLGDGQKLETPVKIAEYALCRASGEQSIRFKYITSASGDMHLINEATTFVEEPGVPPGTSYALYLASQLPQESRVDIYGYRDPNDTSSKYLRRYVEYTDLGIFREEAIVRGALKMYCVSNAPKELYPINQYENDIQEGYYDGSLPGNQALSFSRDWDSTLSRGNKNMRKIDTAFSNARSSSLSWTSGTGDINSLAWNGQATFGDSSTSNIRRSGSALAREAYQNRATAYGFFNIGESVLYRYAGSNLVFRQSRVISGTNAGPEIPPVTAWPFWHVRKDVRIEFANDCDLTHDVATSTTTGSGDLDNLGKFTIEFGATELNPDFNPAAPVPSWTDGAGNTVKQTENLYAGPVYHISYTRNANDPSTTEEQFSRSSMVSLGTAARVISSSVFRPSHAQTSLAKFSDVSELNFSDYMPVGDYSDVTHISLVGVSSVACPADYVPSFSLSYPTEHPAKAYSRTSTHWQNKQDAQNHAAFYLWWENRNYSKAQLTLPLRLDIRAGELVEYAGTKYLVLSVTHTLGLDGATTELECSKV